MSKDKCKLFNRIYHLLLQLEISELVELVATLKGRYALN